MAFIGTVISRSLSRLRCRYSCGCLELLSTLAYSGCVIWAGISYTAVAIAAPLNAEAQDVELASEDDRELHQEGIKQFRAGDQKQAEETFRRVVERSPRYVPARYDLAALLLGQGRLREGLAHYQFIAEKLLPNNAEARHRFALALNRVQQPNKALVQFEKCLAINPQQTAARRDLVKLLLAGRDYMKAVNVSDAGVRLHPEDASVLNDHGVVLMQLGKPSDAVKSFRKAVELDKNHADAVYNMGLALNEQWKLEEAAQHLQAAIKLRPGYTDAHYNLGKVLARKRDNEGARSALNQAITLQSDYYVAHHELGMLALRENEPRQAVRHFTEALRNSPGYLKSQYWMGVAMSKLGRPKLAVAQFEGVLRQSPEHADAHYQLGKALAATDRNEEAVAHMREALWLRPEWKEAQEALESIERPPAK